MTIQEYQKWTPSTAIYPKDRELEYLTLGLISEIGEVAGKLKKQIRDPGKVTNDDIAQELGDCFWYLSQLANLLQCQLDVENGIKGCHSNLNLVQYAAHSLIEMNLFGDHDNVSDIESHLAHLSSNIDCTVGYILQLNHDKLESRKQRDAIKGSGDNR